jgi:hypothetical protein
MKGQESTEPHAPPGKEQHTVWFLAFTRVSLLRDKRCVCLRRSLRVNRGGWWPKG